MEGFSRNAVGPPEWECDAFATWLVESESTSAPWVILVINVNISLVVLMLLSSIFQMSSTMAWQGQEDVEPLQNAKDKGLAQAPSSRLYIFYFSDPRSHWVYRKSQYYQEGMRCCLMACLLKVLSDMFQSPQLLSHIHICPKPKVKLGPTDFIYPAPPSSLDLATARNPRQFGLTDRDLDLTEMALQTLCCLL